MSVLIKGVDMPKNCTWCPCARIDGVTKDPMNNEIFYMVCMVKKDYWTCFRKLSGKPAWCPLVEIKTPHGRLIDEKDLFEQHPGKVTHHHEYGFDWEIRNAKEWLGKYVPTIIEAEE